MFAEDEVSERILEAASSDLLLTIRLPTKIFQFLSKYAANGRLKNVTTVTFNDSSSLTMSGHL